MAVTTTDELLNGLKSDNLISFDERKQNNFILNEDGGIKKLFSNLKIMLSKNQKLKDIEFNEFTQEIITDGKPITDGFLADLRLDISNEYYMDFSKDDILQMVQIIAKEHPVHPIKRSIDSKPWDGVKRAETLFIDYLGADDNGYTRAVTRKWLAGAVARVYQPGIKMEMVPVLQGKQGIGKSTIADKLGGQYFVDSLKSLGNNKDDYQLLIGAWIIELGELSSMNDTKIETMKGFISARWDKLRLPYDKITQSFPRTCVFIGTTNPGQYLRDTTGNRRFFPIPLQHDPTKNVFELEANEIQQVWAEAYQLYVNGEKFYLNDEEEQLAHEYRSEATEENIMLNKIDVFLEMKVPRHWNTMNVMQKRSYFDKYHIEDIQDGNDQIDKTNIEELAKVMKVDENNYPKIKQISMYMDSKDDWEKKAVYMNGKTKRGYKRL